MIIRSISGVRGLTESHLTPKETELYAQAVHQMLPPGSLVVGRDSRPSGAAIIQAMIQRFNRLGRSVIVCGIVPTPTVQFMVENTEAVGGIIVTASHNPAEWNGLKFVTEDGTFFSPERCKTLFHEVDLMDALEEAEPSPSTMAFQENNANQKHVIKVLGLSCIDVEAIRKRHFKIAIDAVNGAGSEALPLLLESLGCEVVQLYCEGTGEFLRGAEPLPENLKELSNTVIKEKAAAGFAVDPDADRLAIVDENGRPLGEEYSLVIAADGYMNTTGASETFVVNLSTSMALEKLAQKKGCKVERAAVGEINVVNRMKGIGANLGGEGNGGVILKEAHLGRDSLVGAAMVLNRMAQTDQPMSAIKKEMPQFEIVKDRLTLENICVDTCLQQMQDVFEHAELNTMDGMKFTWEDRWIHLRKSNTEPIMRIYAEAATRYDAKKLIDKVKSVIK